MADEHEKDAVDEAERVIWECHEVAVLQHSDWLLILDILPAGLAAGLREISWRKGDFL